MQVSGHFHFKASNKEPNDQMDMFLYPPDEETLRKSAKTLIHILYGNTNIPSRQSQNLVFQNFKRAGISRLLKEKGSEKLTEFHYF
jgi:hypothetical protein